MAEKTADLLIEIGTEELPPKALRRLRDAFADGVVSGLAEKRLAHGETNAFASPRRLAVLVTALTTRQEDRELTQKGPPVRIAFDDNGKPTKAALAFAGKCGVEVSELAREQSGDGEWLVHTANVTGQGAAELVPDIVRQSLQALPIPRRMRWGDSDDEFVRPVHWVVMLFGKDVVDCEIFGVQSGKASRGHRFHGDGAIEISAPKNYAELLKKKGHVVADFDARRESIVDGVKSAAARLGGRPVGDDALYDEVSALTEWPVPLTGSFDNTFLELPREAIVATLTSHQRYFPIEDDGGNLLPAFITVANIESKDPDIVRDGNERVIRPRLTDAAFFWETDQQTTLADRVGALSKVVYQKGLGTLHDKSDRVATMAANLAQHTGADEAAVSRAARLAKCDLLTGMVGEFPELQGTMGGYYAAADGEDSAVAAAISDQYKPAFAGDELPASLEGQLLAVADKLDTLAGVFALGKKPSGNRDPFGLRRAALGVVRILIEKGIDIDVRDTVAETVALQPAESADKDAVTRDLHEFLIERLRGYVLDADEGLSSEMFMAVRAREPRTLLDFVARLRAVQAFMRLDEATSLASANKRTANILRQANGAPGAADAKLLAEAAELALHQALQNARQTVEPLLESRDYTEALQTLAALREPVDTFFDDVMVMADDTALRDNRIALLSELRALFLGVADISRLTPPQE